MLNSVNMDRFSDNVFQETHGNIEYPQETARLHTECGKCGIEKNTILFILLRGQVSNV